MQIRNKTILKIATLSIIVCLVFGIGYYVGTTSTLNVHLDDLPTPYSYIIKTDGSKTWAIRYDGRIISTDTNASTVFQAVRDATTENTTIGVRNGDYILSTTFTSAKKLKIIGEGSSTRLLPNGAFDAIDLTNIILSDIVWRDSQSIDHDTSLNPMNIGRLLFDSTAFYYTTMFEGWSLSSATAEFGIAVQTNDADRKFTSSSQGLTMGTLTATVGKYVMVQKFFDGVRATMPQWGSWDKYRALRICLMFSLGTTGHKCFFVATCITPSNPIEQHIGFMVNDGNLYGTVGNGTAQTTLELINAWDGSLSDLECRLEPSKYVDFFVNGVWKGRISSGLPTGYTNATILFEFYVEATAPAETDVIIKQYTFLQEP